MTCTFHVYFPWGRRNSGGPVTLGNSSLWLGSVGNCGLCRGHPAPFGVRVWFLIRVQWSYRTGFHTNLHFFFSSLIIVWVFFFSRCIIICSSFYSYYYFICTIPRWCHHEVHRGKIETQDAESTIRDSNRHIFWFPVQLSFRYLRLPSAACCTRSSQVWDTSMLWEHSLRAMVELACDSLCNVF